MSEYALETRLLGKEDIDFDSAGTNEQTEFTDLNGDPHTVSKLNASHIPLTLPTRAVVDGADNVDSALKNISKNVYEVAAQNNVGIDADKTIILSTVSTRQTQISAPFRNLGGHTLTFKFPEEGDVNVATAPLEFQGFYNGVLVIDLNGSDIHDNGTFSPEGVLRIKNCHCIVRIIGDGRSTSGYGKVIFTDNHYGIAIIHSPSCSIEHIGFESSSTENDYALYAESANAFFDSSCTFTGCKEMLIKSIYRDYTDAHKVDVQAHSSLFAAKADLAHTHPQTAISGLVDDLNGKAPVNHSHGLSDITDFSSGILDSANYASSAGGLTSSAMAIVKQEVGYEYGGPFAVKVLSSDGNGSFTVKVSGGPVISGGSIINVPDTAISSGGSITSSGEMNVNEMENIYLFCSGGTCYFVPSSDTPPAEYSGTYYTKIAMNHTISMNQIQYGTVILSLNDGGVMIPNYFDLEYNELSPGLDPSSTHVASADGVLRISPINNGGAGCLKLILASGSKSTEHGLQQITSSAGGVTQYLQIKSGTSFSISKPEYVSVFLAFAEGESH